MKKNYKKALLFFALLNLAHFSFSQKTDSTKTINHFSGAVSFTNNGISMIPTFTLGKPAAIVNLSIGSKKLSFEPELKFSIEGKPWGFIFWWRYKLVNSGKFRMNVGAHPALAFSTVSLPLEGVAKEKEVIVAKRFLAAEISPTYFLSKNLSVGVYYLYARGLSSDATKNIHFFTINTSISNIKLSNQFFMRVTPQFYYLKLDAQDGFYFTSAFTLAKKNFLLSVSAIINKTINTNITGSKNFVWNASLVYSFNKTYVNR